MQRMPPPSPSHAHCIYRFAVLFSLGRRVVDPARLSGRGDALAPGDIPLHPDFSCIALANRPGYPFLGNDFFRECGDVFSCFIVGNGSKADQEMLLRQYAPKVPVSAIASLVRVFAELTDLCEDGSIAYPYSLRELVSIAKHYNRYPRDGITAALENVLGFDRMDPEMLEKISPARPATLLSTHPGACPNAFT